MRTSFEFTLRVEDQEELEQLLRESWEEGFRSIGEIAEYLLWFAARGVRDPASPEHRWLQEATGWSG